MILPASTPSAGDLTTPRAAGPDRLADLRARIARETRRRNGRLRLSSLVRLGLSLVIVAGVLFLVDWTFSPRRLTRGLMLLVAAAVVAIQWRRVRPGRGQRASETEVALAIEQRQGIDSDLVAALEFADGRGEGSADLRDAVIEYVADFSRSWQMPAQPLAPRLRRRAAWLAAATTAILAAAGLRPDVAAAFLDRMLLGAAHYPSRTRIESLLIGDHRVDMKPGAAQPVKSPLGRAVAVVVGVGGAVPPRVRMRLASTTTGEATEIDLPPDTTASGDAAGRRSAAGADTAARFAARLPTLAESVDVQVFAGDAWTDPVRVEAIAAPLIDLRITATPPAYAAGDGERPAGGARQVTVLEGSTVGMAVRCTNKRLASVKLLVDGLEHRLRPARGAADGPAADWECAAGESPLARLGKTVAYELRVIDEDGLSPDAPIAGSIRVKPDAPPRVTADVQTRLVLPTAAPRLTWRVADDHALASVVVVVEGVAATARSESRAGGRQPETLTIPATLPTGPGGWVERDRLPLEGVMPVRLDALGLEAGDQVRLTVRAADYRGGAAGGEAEGETIVLDVTDERGILAALTETDERSVEQLDAIIDRELTVGGAK